MASSVADTQWTSTDVSAVLQCILEAMYAIQSDPNHDVRSYHAWQQVAVTEAS